MALKFYETRCPKCQRLSSVTFKDEPCDPLIYCGECLMQRAEIIRLQYKEPKSVIWK